MITKTKYTHNQKVMIKTGYYRGYKATIQDYEPKETNPESEEKPQITYKLKIEGIITKQEHWYPEEHIFAYKKYILF